MNFKPPQSVKIPSFGHSLRNAGGVEANPHVARVALTRIVPGISARFVGGRD